MLKLSHLGLCFALASASWVPPPAARSLKAPRQLRHHRSLSPIAAAPPPDLEEVTEKYGLEAGLFSALKNGGAKGGEDGSAKGGMATAGDLLKRYGGAYLLTSTSFAIISFSLCYWAIDNGVDVQSLLQRVGIEVRDPSEVQKCK